MAYGTDENMDKKKNASDVPRIDSAEWLVFTMCYIVLCILVMNLLQFTFRQIGQQVKFN